MTKDKSESKQRRKHLPASEKMAIVRRHLGPKHESVADLAVEYGVQPGSIYLWVQRLLDNGDLALEGKPRGDSRAEKESDRKLHLMTERIAKKDRVIAELSTEYLELKKALGDL